MNPMQYLIMAREIKQSESGVYTYVDVCQHFFVNTLPAHGKFDLAIVCGPGWPAGDYHLHIAVKLEGEDPKKIGFADIKIIDDLHIYTAKFNNLGLAIKNNAVFSFLVYKHPGEFIENQDTTNMLTGDLIIERPFKVIVTEKQLV